MSLKQTLNKLGNNLFTRKIFSRIEIIQTPRNACYIASAVIVICLMVVGYGWLEDMRLSKEEDAYIQQSRATDLEHMQQMSYPESQHAIERFLKGMVALTINSQNENKNKIISTLSIKKTEKEGVPPTMISMLVGAVVRIDSHEIDASEFAYCINNDIPMKIFGYNLRDISVSPLISSSRVINSSFFVEIHNNYLNKSYKIGLSFLGNGIPLPDYTSVCMYHIVIKEEN